MLSTKDGCAAKMAASGDHACGAYRVSAALLAFSTVITCRAQRGRSCEQGAKMAVESHSLAHPVEVLASYLGKSAIAVLVGDSFTPPEVVLRRTRGAELPAPFWLKSFERSTTQ